MERMTTKKEVPKDIVDGAKLLMSLKSSKPTLEECKNIQLWKNNADERKLFARLDKIYNITTTSSSSPSIVMESEIIPKTKDSKADKIKAHVVESSSKPIIRNRKFCPCFDVGTKERMPLWLSMFMTKKNGIGPKMIIEKNLTASDIKSKSGRLSMPFNQIVDFLNSAEERIIEEDVNKESKEAVDAKLVVSDLTEFNVNLRRWDMNTSQTYNLVSGWTKVVEEIDLKKDEKIRLWSFHSKGKLYFALVLLPPTSDSGKSNSERKKPCFSDP